MFEPCECSTSICSGFFTTDLLSWEAKGLLGLLSCFVERDSGNAIINMKEVAKVIRSFDPFQQMVAMKAMAELESAGLIGDYDEGGEVGGLRADAEGWRFGGFDA
jgi:hypothetical protein